MNTYYRFLKEKGISVDKLEAYIVACPPETIHKDVWTEKVGEQAGVILDRSGSICGLPNSGSGGIGDLAFPISTVAGQPGGKPLRKGK